MNRPLRQFPMEYDTTARRHVVITNPGHRERRRHRGKPLNVTTSQIVGVTILLLVAGGLSNSSAGRQVHIQLDAVTDAFAAMLHPDKPSPRTTGAPDPAQKHS